MQQPEHLRRYFLAVSLAGLCALVYASFREPNVSLRVTLMIAVIVAYSEWTQQVLPSGAGVSIGAAALVASAWLYGSSTSIDAVLIGAGIVATVRKADISVAAFNVGMWVFGLVASDLAAHAIVRDGSAMASVMAPTVLYGGYVSSTACLVCVGMSFAQRKPLLAVFGQYGAEAVLPWLGGLAATLVIVHAGEGWGVGGSLAALTALLVLQTLLTRWGTWLRGRAVDRILGRLRAASYARDRRTRLAVHYAAAVAAELGLDADQQANVREAALLHDVAMESALPGVLANPSALTIQERRRLHLHPQIAAGEIARVSDMADIAEAVRHHHESWSGGGYPDGLAGEHVPVASRILAAVDSYLAVAEPFPYKGALTSPEDGIAAIQAERGARLWPPAVDALRAVVAREVAQNTLLREGARQIHLQATVDNVIGSLLRARRSEHRFSRAQRPDAHRWRALHEFSRTVNSSLDTAEVADITLSAVTRLSAAGGLLAVRDEEGRFIIRAIRRAGESLLGLPLEPLDREARDSLAEGRAVSRNLRQAGAWARPFARRGLVYGRLVPAYGSGRTVAVLVLAGNRPASDVEVELAEMAASQAALALSNASLFEDRERRLREIHELHQLTDAILENMKTAVVLFDDQRVIRLANREARRIFRDLGLGPLEAGMTGDQLAAVIGGDRAAVAELSARARVAEGSLDCGEWTFWGPKAQVRVSLTLSRLRGVSGQADGGFVVVAHDISEHVHLRDEVQKRERLAAVGKLAASAAHEIRNPLTAIKGFLQILHADPDPDHVAEYLPIVLSELQRIETLTGDMLLLARPPMPEGAYCDLAAEVREMLRLVTAKAKAEGVEIDFHMDEADLPAGVPVDPPRARQVLLNMVQNALDAMPAGGRLHIGLGGDDRTVRLTVTDTGPGIEEAVRERIFEPFVTTKPNGTGLGLATSASIVQAAGGHIDVEDPPEGGARFRITWPRADRPLDVSASSHQKHAPAPETARPARAGRMGPEARDGPVAEGGPDLLRWAWFGGTGAPGTRL